MISWVIQYFVSHCMLSADVGDALWRLPLTFSLPGNIFVLSLGLPFAEMLFLLIWQIGRMMREDSITITSLISWRSCLIGGFHSLIKSNWTPCQNPFSVSLDADSISRSSVKNGLKYGRPYRISHVYFQLSDDLKLCRKCDRKRGKNLIGARWRGGISSGLLFWYLPPTKLPKY